MFKWITESNRLKHLFGGAILALLFTFFCAMGCGGGMEFKDKAWGGKWDWLDFIATCLGGLIGQALQLLIIYIIIKL